MIGFPLVLQSNITTFNSTAGAVRGVDNPIAFQAPGKGALLVEAISFAFDHFAPHEVQIQIGRAKITNGYVPITSILTPLESRLWGNNRAACRNAASTWRFDHPLYVPTGTRLSFMWRAATTTLSKVQIALKCRHLPENYPEPKAVVVPWATMFRPGPTLASIDNTTAALFKSIIGDVTNHFRTALRVRHLIGDGTCGSDAAGEFVNDADIAQDAMGPSQQATQRFLAQVQIRDWLGNNIVRDPTPLVHLCQPARREWRLDFALPPTRTLFVTMDERHTSAVGAGGANIIRPSIGLVGWRQEVIGEVK
jgi:hypothetical protein